jgi:hypothetical protein
VARFICQASKLSGKGRQRHLLGSAWSAAQALANAACVVPSK